MLEKQTQVDVPIGDEASGVDLDQYLSKVCHRWKGKKWHCHLGVILLQAQVLLSSLEDGRRQM